MKRQAPSFTLLEDGWTDYRTRAAVRRGSGGQVPGLQKQSLPFYLLLPSLPDHSKAHPGSSGGAGEGERMTLGLVLAKPQWELGQLISG